MNYPKGLGKSTAYAISITLLLLGHSVRPEAAGAEAVLPEDDIAQIELSPPADADEVADDEAVGNEGVLTEPEPELFTDDETFLDEGELIEPEPELPTEVILPGENSYLLGVGDFVSVDVFNIPDYSGDFRVLSGGVLNLPIAGQVIVEGLSLEQAAGRIESQLQSYVRRPRVTLSLLQARPLQVAIAGEVRRPGAYRVTAEEDSERLLQRTPTLTQVIELAGGITQIADIRRIKVERRRSSIESAQLADGFAVVTADSEAVTESTDFRTISINLWDLLESGNLDADLRLQDGDRIFIPTADALTADEIAELASASFSPDQISVNVVGEVDSPGTIQVPPNTPLNQAILAAGGFNSRARRTTVSLIRLNPNGTATEREIDIDFSRGIDDEGNPSLRPNDTVIVRRSGLAAASDTIGSVFSPLNGIFNILRIFGIR